MIRPGVWRRELAVPLQSIQIELNRLFDEYWRPPGAPETGPTTPPTPGATARPTEMASGVWTPAIDLWETPTDLTLVVDLPGVDPASIDLSLAGNVLSLRGEKLAATVQPGQKSAPAVAPRGRVRERSVGSFHREITLVDEVDFDRVEAQSKDGVLTVRLPKRDVGQPRTITIQPAG